MAIDFLAPAKAFEVEYGKIQCKLGRGQRQSAAHKSELGSLRRPATVVIANAVFEIKSLKVIKGASHRAAIKRARSTRSSRPRVGGIKTKLKSRFSCIKFKEWRQRHNVATE
ncbi:hypothetical protein H9P43_003807 [Blastocladiella emersonii ATCC 22665]|nr:hypothetical protein H9P43_003807 [Blastocladiella emersonii ATCC 22665]